MPPNSVRVASFCFEVPRQVYLQRVLGFVQPEYAHVPLVLNGSGVRR